jgi:glycosyltransferase EpsE
MSKKVSVIMSVYNDAEYLNIAIDSIIQQTYKNWEFVICDDASNDKTWEILMSYKQRYPKQFIIFQNTQNMKLAYSLNECLKRVSGELIARMDADDISNQSRFEKQVKYLNDNPGVHLVGTEVVRFDDTTRNIIEMESIPNKFHLVKRVTFIHPTIMTYKYVYDAVDGYTVKTRTNLGQDYDFYFKFFAADFVGHNIKEPLYEYRKIINSQYSMGILGYIRYDFKMMKTQWIGFKTLKFPIYFYLFIIVFRVYSVSKFIIRKTLGLL